MKFPMMVAAAALALAAAPALAQAGPTVGATVLDPQGGEVGTIAAVGDGYVVVDTGSNQVTLPPEAVGSNDTGLVMGMTKAELDAAAEKAEAEAEAALTAALVAGAPLHGINGAPAGTIKAVNADGSAVVAHELGEVPLPRDQFTTTDKGLALKFTAAQLEGALSQRAEAAAAVAAALVPGAALVTSDGVAVGTIREIDANGNAVIDRTDGSAFALPKDQFMVDASGKLALIFSDADLKAALGG